MTLVEMYSKEDCHLCDAALDILKRTQQKVSFELTIIKLKEGDAEFDTYKERFPVIFINKEFAYQYRVPEGDLLTKLMQVVAGQ